MLARSLRARSLAHNGFAQAHRLKLIACAFSNSCADLAPCLRRACTRRAFDKLCYTWFSLNYNVNKDFRTTSFESIVQVLCTYIYMCMYECTYVYVHMYLYVMYAYVPISQ